MKAFQHVGACCHAVKELTQNHRQVGDNHWGACLNVLRKGTDKSQLDSVYDILKTRVGDLHGSTVCESAFADAMHLLLRTVKLTVTIALS